MKSKIKYTHTRIFAILLCLLLVLSGCAENPKISGHQTELQPSFTDQAEQNTAGSNTEAPAAPDISDGIELQVYIFDVGQASCVVAVTGEDVLMIDAGDIGQA